MFGFIRKFKFVKSRFCASRYGYQYLNTYKRKIRRIEIQHTLVFYNHIKTNELRRINKGNKYNILQIVSGYCIFCISLAFRHANKYILIN